MSCEGCIFSAKQQRRELETVRQNAKQYAQQQNTQVVIFFDGQKWEYCTLARATAENIPYTEVLSQY